MAAPFTEMGKMGRSRLKSGVNRIPIKLGHVKLELTDIHKVGAIGISMIPIQRADCVIGMSNPVCWKPSSPAFHTPSPNL